MRCAQVIRQLAAPSDDHDATAVADHLLACPTCAAWAKDATRLEQLWHSTKPAVPSSQTWDAMWATIQDDLKTQLKPKMHTLAVDERASRPSFLRGMAQGGSTLASAKRRPWVVVGLIGMAQAAAILVAIGTVAWQRRQPEQNWQTSSLSANANLAVEIEAGRVVMIQSEGEDASVIDVTPDEFVYSVDAWYEMFNIVEWMASPKLALKE